MSISDNLDMLSCELMGEAFDRLASGEGLAVVASIMDEAGERLTCEFDDDSPEVCLEAAHEWVRRRGSAIAGAKGTDPAQGLAGARYYAIAYQGAVAEGDLESEEAYQDALLLEFGEQGAECGYSAYALVRGVGKGEDFRWTDPLPAGELPCLL